MNVQVTLDISSQKISDQLITAFEGGSNYWLQTAELITSVNAPTERPWYSSPVVFDSSFTFKVGYDDPNLEEGNGQGRRTIGLAAVKDGLQTMAEKFPRHFADLVSEEGDAITADVFLQCVVFDDVIYS
jgi:hypothetical protein